MVEIAKLRQLCNSKNIVLTEHARQRLVERRISIQDILQAIKKGKSSSNMKMTSYCQVILF
ncbi:MAG: DUF4258 domain-containing protein [Spirochaetaceae bacterium]|nr:DUF4258 domain-containing protein [Spirochaetaceae bacterium]